MSSRPANLIRIMPAEESQFIPFNKPPPANEEVFLRAIIFANGIFTKPVSPLFSVQEEDIVIAADGGFYNCRSMGFTPHVLIGDFDSLQPDDLATIRKKHVRVIQHPANKDYTDLELALLHARSLGASEVFILGALGARWDQTLANILLPTLRTLDGVRITLLDGRQEIHFLDSRDKPASLEINAKSGTVVSLIPLLGDVSGITTTGLEYPLNDESLFLGATRGVSNLLRHSPVRITLKHGFLICVVIHEQSD